MKDISIRSLWLLEKYGKVQGLDYPWTTLELKRRDIGWMSTAISLILSTKRKWVCSLSYQCWSRKWIQKPFPLWQQWDVPTLRRSPKFLISQLIRISTRHMLILKNIARKWHLRCGPKHMPFTVKIKNEIFL